MATLGYVTHAARNRRLTWWLLAGYLLAFQAIGAFSISLVLLIFDHEHTILSNPAGYALRYAVPMAGVAGLTFWVLYRGQAAQIARTLDIRFPGREQEPRLFRIAEEQCMALGVRQPRFGIIEIPACNALTVGEGPARGLIAVTRGLLDALDDDELAAVLAHEASHIRNGDTRLLAANHALMRTAVIMQTHNPLRLEHWQQMLIALMLPFYLVIVLISGTTTMTAMRLARAARRGLRLSRDHIADGEAVRATLFPDALVSALRKIGGRGAFEGSERIEGALFDGRADREGGTHPAVEDRIAAITALAGPMMEPGRARRDTRGVRPACASGFGRRGSASPPIKRSRPAEPPEKPSIEMLMLFFTDRERFRRWQYASVSQFEWREGEPRNAFGIAPDMLLPLAATVTFLLVLHWPADGDFTRMARMFSPTAMVDIARAMNGPAIGERAGHP